MKLDRRTFMLSAAGLLVPAEAALAQPPRRDPTRHHSTPDLDRFADAVRSGSYPIMAGWRPLRRVGGARRMRLDYTRAGPKKILYNYGHSGAGVTLSLGSASLLERHMSLAGTAPDERPRVGKDARIVVVGAGVVGLATAFVLQQSGYRQVEIVADRVASGSFDQPQTVSDIAGGQFDAAGMDGVTGNVLQTAAVRPILRESLRVLVQDDRGKAFRTGVYTAVRNYVSLPGYDTGALREASEVVHEIAQDSLARLGRLPELDGPLGAPAGVRAPFDNLSDRDVRFGGRTTLLVNTNSLVKIMLHQLRNPAPGLARVPINDGRNGTRLGGGPGRGVRINAFADIERLEADAVIVCAGLGSARIVQSDPGAIMQSIYGLLVKGPRIEFPAGEARYLYSGFGYMFPRDDGTIFGGAWDDKTDLRQPPQNNPLISVRTANAGDKDRAVEMVCAVAALLRNQCGDLRGTLASGAWFSGHNYRQQVMTRACRPTPPRV